MQYLIVAEGLDRMADRMAEVEGLPRPPLEGIETDELCLDLERSIEIKPEFVSLDPFERGAREALHFGHGCCDDLSGVRCGCRALSVLEGRRWDEGEGL